MDILWAPWRMEYIKTADIIKECFLCDAIKQTDDKKNLIIIRTQTCLGVLNRYPYNHGHVMVAPLAHKAKLEDLSESEMLDLLKLVLQTKSLLDKILAPHGYNIGINLGRCAGAGLDSHLHIHIVPRWHGDTNFMPVCASTKVISMSLEDLYDKLKECLISDKA